MTITPGSATAMVVRSAASAGRRAAFVCTAGNSLGVLGVGLRRVGLGVRLALERPVTRGLRPEQLFGL